VRPIAELRAEALKAKPPEELGPFHFPNLIELTKIDSSIHLDIRYATANNFLGETVYEQARAFLQASAADALKQVSKKLRKKGYGLLVYDAYRPWYVTKILWDATPAAQRGFLTDPTRGSRHNLGCAVDLTLYDMKTGAVVAMPSEFEEMTLRAHADYAGATPEETRHREVLREAMTNAGFTQNPNEWWHFDYKDWQRYAILNFPLDHIPDFAPPRIVKLVSPEFSEEAMKKHVEGTVVLSVTIDRNGVPSDVRVVQSLGHGSDEKAIEAAKQCRFKPGVQDGKPVPVTVDMTMTFRLYH
jgi:D-alanyl-D-alanine dipeptidase